MTRPDSPDLSPARRVATLDELSGASVDVLVVGGGVTGAGAALDAAARGLDVLLVERDDLASGTSSRSTKLVHGGLRYLEQLDLPLVREALAERGRQVSTIAPHLVRPLSFLFPLGHHWQRVYVGSGIALYDGLAIVGGDHLPRHRHLGRRETLSAFPSLRGDHLVGAVRYWDGQMDDARHTIAVARTAAAHGARILTDVEVVGLNDTAGRITGAQLRDRGSGHVHEVKAGVVVNATGPWSAETERLAQASSLRMRTSKGVHLVVPRHLIQGSEALITKTASSVLFVIPQGENWLIGTTDTAWHNEKGRGSAGGAVTSSDVDYLLEQTNSLLSVDLDRSDVIGTFSGLRPLVEPINDAAGPATTKLSREHLTASPRPGLVSIAGGKYTTYRVMAADAVDAAMEQLGRPDPGCETADLPLVGAVDRHGSEATIREWADHFGDTATAERLVGRYGAEISRLLDLARERPELAQPVSDASPYLRVEIVFAVRYEGARHLDDLLSRRTRMIFDSPGRGVDAAPAAADLAAHELGWTAERTAAEVAAHEARVAAEHAAETVASDTEAAAIMARLNPQRDNLSKL